MEKLEQSLAVQYGILDKEQDEMRSDIYDSYDEAKHEFADYWRDHALDDWQESFNYDNYKEKHGITHELTESEMCDIAKQDLASMSDDDIFDYFGFAIVELH